MQNFRLMRENIVYSSNSYLTKEYKRDGEPEMTLFISGSEHTITYLLRSYQPSGGVSGPQRFVGNGEKTAGLG
jgi:hypothetical protein